VTGGTPIGFDVGAKEAGGTLRGLDLVCLALNSSNVQSRNGGLAPWVIATHVIGRQLHSATPPVNDLRL